MLAQKMEEMLERRRARYTAWAKEFGFDPPPEKGGREMLDTYAREHADDLQRADILDEVQRIKSGQLFGENPRKQKAFVRPQPVPAGGPRRPCLAEQAEEMLERRRSFLADWSREFGFEQPPQSGGWEDLDAYEARNAAAIEHADMKSEVNRILGDA